MSSIPEISDDVIRNYPFPCFSSFIDRVEGLKHKIDQITLANRSLTTIGHFQNYLQSADIKAQPAIREIIAEITEYGRSISVHDVDYGPLNEATVVLLSAYLETFIEELYADAMKELLQEKPQCRGVLEAVISDAHDRFQNPNLQRIKDLFATINIETAVNQLSPEIKSDLSRFVARRNDIAHGKKGVSVSKEEVQEYFRFVRGCADDLALRVRAAIPAAPATGVENLTSRHAG
jgi:hypothetical protein